MTARCTAHPGLQHVGVKLRKAVIENRSPRRTFAVGWCSRGSRTALNTIPHCRLQQYFFLHRCHFVWRMARSASITKLGAPRLSCSRYTCVWLVNLLSKCLVRQRDVTLLDAGDVETSIPFQTERVNGIVPNRGGRMWAPQEIKPLAKAPFCKDSSYSIVVGMCAVNSCCACHFPLLPASLPFKAFHSDNPPSWVETSSRMPRGVVQNLVSPGEPGA